MSEDKGREFEVVNHSVPRRDGRAKVSGRALYVSDVRLAGMAYAKVLRSPYAHARIVSMDTSKAESHPGVYNVLRGDDLEGLNPYFGHAVKDHPLIAIDKVRYAGEPVAAVIAEDELTAYEALELIRVEYEELPAVMEPQESLAQERAPAARTPVRGRRPAWLRGRGHRGPGLQPVPGAPRQVGRRGRGLCQGRGGGGERILLPHGLCLCHGALRGHCRGGRRRRHHLLVGPAPLHGAARPQDHLRYAGEPDSPHRAVRGRRLRQQVVHQGRAAGVGLRLEGAASGEAPAQRGRGHAHHPRRRRVDLDAHRGGRRRQDHRAPGQDLHEHRGLRGEQPAGVREVVQPLRRPLRHSQTSRSTTTRSTPTPCRPAPSGASAAPR